MPTRLLWHRQHLNALCRVTPWWTVLLLKGSHFGDWLTHTAYSTFCAYSSHPSKSIIPISGQSNTFSGEGFSAIALFLFAAGPLSLIPFFSGCVLIPIALDLKLKRKRHNPAVLQGPGEENWLLKPCLPGTVICWSLWRMKMPRVCLVSKGKMRQIKRNIPAVRVLSGFQRARLIWTDFISVLRSVSARSCVLRHTLLMTPIIIWCGFDLIHVVALAFQYSVQTTSSMTGLSVHLIFRLSLQRSC